MKIAKLVKEHIYQNVIVNVDIYLDLYIVLLYNKLLISRQLAYIERLFIQTALILSLSQ